jgi:hypothetical protein
VFTARYALSPYIKQIRFVFKELICEALRRVLMLLSHECGEDSTTKECIETTHRSFTNSNVAATPKRYEFCGFRIPIHNLNDMFSVSTRLNIPVTRSTTLAIHICGQNRISNVHSSLAFRGFVHRGFANLRSCPKNKNVSLAPFKGQQHQHFSTTLTGLRATKHGVPRRCRKKRSRSHYKVPARKRKTLKNTKTFFGG